jgi:hypothetical protein
MVTAEWSSGNRCKDFCYGLVGDSRGLLANVLVASVLLRLGQQKQEMHG